MACPYAAPMSTSLAPSVGTANSGANTDSVTSPKNSRVKFMDYADEESQEGVNKVELGFGRTYSEYLQLDKLLDCQKLQSEVRGQRVDDEHLFVIMHQNWLERTPGLKETDGDEGFWPKYERAVKQYLNDMYLDAVNNDHPKQVREQLLAEYYKTKDSFVSILDPKQHEIQMKNGNCLFSHDAMKGALIIYFYRDMPRFSQPYQILTYLMDIDSLFTKWRYNHVLLVQRMRGSKQSSYMYLRSTVSDRYKVFLDLFNLSTWLIPREYIPVLSPRMVKTLSEHSNLSSTLTSESE
ncbi:hypothetical protein WR25_03409 [Diploscapter pachys]|uniref:Tryptophan 2,3-dioxygenase n=1 Tax=Diploscapter pachys TaxID=2018661 RepID=A0A2A2LTA7_9BILA|nr:hypothetical protein WR25_03409 [Diploscapter pachys]